MPTPMTHGLAGAAAAQFVPKRFSKPRAAIAFAILGIAPDFDIAGFYLGMPYGNVLGHRGISHSLTFALFVGITVAIALYWSDAGSFRESSIIGFLSLSVVASHALLDALTNGGLGVGLLMPFVNERFFFDIRPIEVCAISPRRFFMDAARVMTSEARCVWMPVMAGSAVLQITKKGFALCRIAGENCGGRSKKC